MVNENPYLDVFETQELMDQYAEKFQVLYDMYNEYLTNKSAIPQSIRFRKEARTLLETPYLKDLFLKYVQRKQLIDLQTGYAQDKLRILKQEITSPVNIEDYQIESVEFFGEDLQVDKDLVEFMPKINNYVLTLPKMYQDRFKDLVLEFLKLDYTIVISGPEGTVGATSYYDKTIILAKTTVKGEAGIFYLALVHEMIHALESEYLDLEDLPSNDVLYVKPLMLKQMGLDVKAFEQRHLYLLKLYFNLALKNSEYLYLFSDLSHSLHLSVNEVHRLALVNDLGLMKEFMLEVRLLHSLIVLMIDEFTMESELKLSLDVFTTDALTRKYQKEFNQLYLLKIGGVNVDFLQQRERILKTPQEEELFSKYVDACKIAVFEIQFWREALDILESTYSYMNMNEYFAYTLQNYYLAEKRILPYEGLDDSQIVKDSLESQEFKDIVERWQRFYKDGVESQTKNSKD